MAKKAAATAVKVSPEELQEIETVLENAYKISKKVFGEGVSPSIVFEVFDYITDKDDAAGVTQFIADLTEAQASATRVFGASVNDEAVMEHFDRLYGEDDDEDEFEDDV